jgi:hypothetical protein
MITTRSENQIMRLEPDVPSDRTTTLLKQIRSFSSFEHGWCHGRGEVFSESTINRAETVAQMFGAFGWEAEAFPGPDGDIAVSATSDSGTLRVTVEQDEPLLVERKVDRRTVAEWRVSAIEFYYLLSQIPSQWNTSGLCILCGGVPPKISGMISHLNPPARNAGAAFQWWIQHAPQNEAEAYVRTLQNFARRSGRRIFFGDSTQTYLKSIR